MDNDFHYKPAKSSASDDPQPDDELASSSAESAGESAGSNTGSDETSTEPAPPERPASDSDDVSSGAVVTDRPRRSQGILVFLVMLVLLLAAAAGVYYWQHQKVKSAETAQASAESKVSNLQSQLDKQKSTTAQSPAQSGTSTTDIVTGQVISQKSGSADVSVLFQSGKAGELWVEYGTAPDKLDQATAHSDTTKQLGTVTGGGAYISAPFTLTGLKGDTYYYYRAAAKQGTQTLYGGVVAFRSQK